MSPRKKRICETNYDRHACSRVGFNEVATTNLCRLFPQESHSNTTLSTTGLLDIHAENLAPKKFHKQRLATLPSERYALFDLRHVRYAHAHIAPEHTHESFNYFIFHTRPFGPDAKGDLLHHSIADSTLQNSRTPRQAHRHARILTLPFAHLRTYPVKGSWVLCILCVAAYPSCEWSQARRPCSLPWCNGPVKAREKMQRCCTDKE